MHTKINQTMEKDNENILFSRAGAVGLAFATDTVSTSPTSSGFSKPLG